MMSRIVSGLTVFLIGLVFSASLVSAQGETVNLINPIGGTEQDPQGISRLGSDDPAQKPIVELTARIITSALGLVGSLTLLVFIYGGFVWLTSAGAPDKVKKGWSAMVYAAIGLFIIFGAYAILSTVIRGLTGS